MTNITRINGNVRSANFNRLDGAGTGANMHVYKHPIVSDTGILEAPGTGERYTIVLESEFKSLLTALSLAEAMAEQALSDAIKITPRHSTKMARRTGGNAVAAVREDLNVSLSQLAAQTGLCERYISGIEDGTQRPTLTAIRKIAKALNVTIDELVGT